jgi:predicted RNA-binding protein Jag
MNEQDLKTVSEDYLNFKNYKIGSNKDYPTFAFEKTEHTRKKTFDYDFNGNFTKILGNYLLNIYRQQKFTFKLTIEFSFLRIKVDDEGFKTKDIGAKNNYIKVFSNLSYNKNADFVINKLKMVATTPTFISDLFLKNDVDKIWLDIDTASKELSNKYLKKLIKDFERSKGLEGQPIKLQPMTNLQRKYVKDMLKINPEYNNTLVNMLDKKVLVIDDVLTSGKTLNDIKLILSSLNTNKVMLFVMFG